jgi:hypothetical protein
MYEKILEILNENLCVPNRNMGQNESAKEIADMNRKFVEWSLREVKIRSDNLIILHLL